MRASINELLASAKARNKNYHFGANPQALIVPHAGYIYSGKTAASAYASLPSPHLIRRVLLLGPSHRVGFHGIASPACDSFETPLGEVAIDTRTLYLLKQQQLVKDHREAHRWEHCLEVQLPYLQETLGHFELIPLLIGDAPPQHIAQVVDDVIAEYQQQGFNTGELLIIISSDLSHYHEYQVANQKDQRTSFAICQHSHSLKGDEACGCRAINGFMMSQLAANLTVECIDLCNSGDTCGNKDRVVGYGAFTFTYKPADGLTPSKRNSRAKADTSQDTLRNTEPPLPDSDSEPLLANEDKKILLATARSAIGNRLNPDIGLIPAPDSLTLREIRSCFVSLHKHGKLRGCMGALRGYQPLYLDVIEHAQAAAFRDYRYHPVNEDELIDLDIEISILSIETPIQFSSERQLLSQINVGVDGLTIETGSHHATFLPSVWTQLHTAEEFLLHLKQKAGLTVGAWPTDIKAWRYSTVQFSEKEGLRS
ncbi:AmmeMemoRadiSam system protein B [Pseudomaricurvus hydrocarbonicus]